MQLWAPRHDSAGGGSLGASGDVVGGDAGTGQDTCETGALRAGACEERGAAAAAARLCAAEEVHGWSWRAVDWFDEGGGGGENAQAVQRDGAQGYAAGPVSTRRTYEMSHVDIPTFTLSLPLNIARLTTAYLASGSTRLKLKLTVQTSDADMDRYGDANYNTQQPPKRLL